MEFSLTLLGWQLDFSLEPDKDDPDDKKPGPLGADTDRDGEPFETNAKQIGFR